MTAPCSGPLDDDVVKARFLASLAMEGIVLSPEQADGAAADFLLLDRQIRLIRAAIGADTPLPIGFSPATGTG